MSDPYAPPPGDQPPPVGPPQPGAPQPGPPQAQYAPQWGAPGKPRSIGVCILLQVVTLGIYGLYWVWVTHEDVKRHSGQGVGGPLGFIIYFVVSPVTFFLLPSEVEKMLKQAGRPSKVSAKTGFWFFLILIGWIIWFVKVQGQLNEYWESLGARA